MKRLAIKGHRNLDPWDLGASLYVPATHPHLQDILEGRRLNSIRSRIICLEDAVSDTDAPAAEARLIELLSQLQDPTAVTFIRPRDTRMLERLSGVPGIQHIAGYVLPKAGPDSVCRAAEILAHASAPHWLMPTLETANLFRESGREALLQALLRTGIRERILALRIGGNDLLATLALRRTRGVTAYEGPLGSIIADLVKAFRPAGFPLTAPVYDAVDDRETLAREVRSDLAFGLIGKTAIHPTQLAVIESAYAVSEEEVSMAKAVLAEDAPAVFLVSEQLCEAAVHRPWAEAIMARAARYGVQSAVPQPLPTRLRR